MAKKTKFKDKPSKPKSIDERATKLVLDSKKESLEFYNSKLKRFNYFDRLYIKGAAKKNTPFGRANLELPIAFQQIEPFVSQMGEALFGEAPYIQYSPRGAEDESNAEKITRYTQYQTEVGGLVVEGYKFLRNLGKYGTAVMKVLWETDIITVEDEIETEKEVVDPVSGKTILVSETEAKERDIKLHDGPRFANISIFDFFVPKSASSTDIQKMPWCIHRVYRTFDEILSNPNYNRNRDKIKSLKKQFEEDEVDNKYSSNSGFEEAKKRELEQKNENGLKKFEGKIEVLEWWGHFKHSEDSEKIPSLLAIAQIGSENIALRVDPHPLKFKFKPFVAANDYQIEGEFYGYGELDHIKGLTEEATALRNARLDVANQSLNSMWIVERQSGVNLRELYSAPNKVILTNDKSAIQRLDMGGVTPSSVNELARIDFDIQNTTEIINPRQDVSNVGAAFGSTATGVNFLSSRTTLRLKTKIRLLEETFFKPLARILNWYNSDLLTEETYFRLSNDPTPYKISPEAFAEEVDYKPVSASEKFGRLQRRDDLTYMMQVIAQIEKVAPGTSNLPEILKEVWKTTGFPHPEKMIKPQQTLLIQTPDGKITDKNGNPPQVVQVDEEGKPVAPTAPTIQ